MLEAYFKALYQRTMREAYSLAAQEIVASLSDGGECLDCGASDGYWMIRLRDAIGLADDRYYGIEWDRRLAQLAHEIG